MTQNGSWTTTFLRAAGSLEKTPASHQQTALERMSRWYSTPTDGTRGTILALPTGGGKTYTATYFACRHAISQGYKILWLAHTHHLLEQAFETFRELTPGLVHGAILTRNCTSGSRLQ